MRSGGGVSGALGNVGTDFAWFRSALECKMRVLLQSTALLIQADAAGPFRSMPSYTSLLPSHITSLLNKHMCPSSITPAPQQADTHHGFAGLNTCSPVLFLNTLNLAWIVPFGPQAFFWPHTLFKSQQYTW